jgi:hypothetical protein
MQPSCGSGHFRDHGLATLKSKINDRRRDFTFLCSLTFALIEDSKVKEVRHCNMSSEPALRETGKDRIRMSEVRSEKISDCHSNRTYCSLFSVWWRNEGKGKQLLMLFFQRRFFALHLRSTDREICIFRISLAPECWQKMTI